MECELIEADIRIRRKFVVHSLCCYYRQRKCCSDLYSLKKVLFKECEKIDVQQIALMYILVYLNHLPSSYWSQTLPDDNSDFYNHFSGKSFVMFLDIGTFSPIVARSILL